ncbi:MAG TPA: GTPase Era [Alphaproteobacteria bacterium]|nr:GTPase Era [Alphaproteobacteria bacterium]
MTRCGFVTLLGAPNAGKSTLVNTMVGAKVSIVSPKVQTTRSRVRGIVVKDDCEIVLVDTPGIFKPKRRLDRAMVAAAWQEAEYTDLRVLMVDARRGLDDDTRAIADSLKNNRLAAVLVLNKTDLVKPEKLLELSAQLNASYDFKETFMLSAATAEGVKEFEDWLAQQMPESPFMFPEDQVSDLPNRLLAAEITREKLYMNLNQELPYVTTVLTDSWKDLDNGAIRLDQTIFVEREKQRQIVLGKNGAMIKKIGMQARQELEELFECRVHLFLFVKVREKWGDNPELYRPWGLDFNA